MMIELDKYIQLYSYVVEYSLKDEAYLAHCVELKITAHGDTHEEAIQEIKEATKVDLLMLAEDEKEIPSWGHLYPNIGEHRTQVSEV